MGEKRYYIVEVGEDYALPGAVTKGEFIKRLDSAFREAFCTLTEKMDWDKVIEIVLHGKKEE
jgi:hypothetical protein